MRTEKGKNILLAVLVIGLVSLTIAYAALIQQLDIKSSAIVQKNSTGWDVHFRTVSCQASEYAEVTSPLQPAASNTTLLDGLVATLKAPGASVTCTFYVENSGNIDAKITGYQKQNPSSTITYTGSGDNKTADEQLVTDKVHYSLVYVDDNKEPKVDDVLNSGDNRQLKLTLTLDNELSQLPEASVRVDNFYTYIIYGQK